MKPIEHDTAIDWLKQTCAVIREMDKENKKLKKEKEWLLEYILEAETVDDYRHAKESILRVMERGLNDTLES